MRSKETFQTTDGRTAVKVDTTKRLKRAHRQFNAEEAAARRPQVSLREFARLAMATPLREYVEQWRDDKRRTDHPKRARSKFVIQERAQRRWARRSKGNPKGKGPK